MESSVPGERDDAFLKVNSCLEELRILLIPAFTTPGYVGSRTRNCPYRFDTEQGATQQWVLVRQPPLLVVISQQFSPMEDEPYATLVLRDASPTTVNQIY